MVGADAFFREQRETSETKSLLVTKYFDAWSRVMVTRSSFRRIAYVDLFAGPGRYEDGKPSTPLMVLELAIKRPDLRERLVTVFNDADPAAVRNLESEILKLPGISSLRYPPRVFCSEINDDVARHLESIHLVPSLVFIDPWGYKGLTLRLLGAVIKDWGCECVFFFNYTRINAGLPNNKVEPHIAAIFGNERLQNLRRSVLGLAPHEREEVVLNSLTEALRVIGAKFMLPFRFRRPDGGRTTHHLIFITKNVLGFEIMKDIMYRHSRKEDGGARFEFWSITRPDLAQTLLDLVPHSVAELEAELLRRFAGRTLTVGQIYKEYGEGTFYHKDQHKEVLLRLEVTDRIRCEPPASIRPRRQGRITMGDTVRVTFPGPVNPSRQ